MKILKKGAKPKPTIKHTCRECGCVFEFEPHEAQYESSPRPGEDGYRGKCPQCQAEFYAYPH